MNKWKDARKKYLAFKDNLCEAHVNVYWSEQGRIAQAKRIELERLTKKYLK